MVIKPRAYETHTVIMSIGDRDDLYAVMGMGEGTNTYKFNGQRTADGVVTLDE